MYHGGREVGGGVDLAGDDKARRGCSLGHVINFGLSLIQCSSLNEVRSIRSYCSETQKRKPSKRGCEVRDFLPFWGNSVTMNG